MAEPSLPPPAPGMPVADRPAAHARPPTTPDTGPGGLPTCPYCHGPRGPGLFCTSCDRFNRNPNNPVIVANRLRRLGGYLLESVLFIITLGIGWLIWLAITAPRAQTPAKSLLSMYIVGEDGSPVSARKVWIREVLVKWILLGITAAIFSGLVHLANALWILFDRDRQTIHDKVVGTVIFYAPDGLDPPPRVSDRPARAPQEELDSLARARDNGEITVYEYEERRQRLLERR